MQSKIFSTLVHRFLGLLREIARDPFKSIQQKLSIEEIEFPQELKGKYQKFTKLITQKLIKSFQFKIHIT